MNEKTILTDEDIRFILDIEAGNEDQIQIKSMDQLIEMIKNDPNSKQKLRKFLAPKESVLKRVLMDFESRLEFFEDNYCIKNTEEPESIVEPIPDTDDTILYETKTDCDIIKEMESEGYKSIVLETEDVFSSVEVNLTESTVIENGSLKFTWRKNDPLDLSKIFLMEKSGNKVWALGHIIKGDSDNKYWAVFDDRSKIFYDLFEGQTQTRIVVFTTDGKTHCCISEMNYLKMTTEKEKPLCIDFGTSNTTVGTYGIKTTNDIEIVKFVDVTVEPHNINASMLPTVVYVLDCSDEKNIQYIFGYEALKKIEQEEHYEFKASAFFEIKRWMTSPSSHEEIRDINNNKAIVERKKIR